MPDEFDELDETQEESLGANGLHEVEEEVGDEALIEDELDEEEPSAEDLDSLEEEI